MLLLVCVLISGLDMSGYLETRPYALWSDSLTIAGFSRGWVEGKTAARMYGALLGIEMIVPYDTVFVNTVLRESIAISRLAAWIGPENVRVTVGKQRLSWGVGRVFRPLDVFNPVNYFEPGYERSGINAVLGYCSLNDVTDVQGVYTPEQNWRRSLGGASIRTTLLHNDIGLVGMHRPDDHFTLVGGEIAGELLVGYWGEYAYIQMDTVDFSTFTLGMDYSFPVRLYVMAEYFFDGSGVADPSEYDILLIISGERTTLAQHYLYLSASTVPFPFDVLRPSVGALVNLDDHGIAVIPQIRIVPFENTDLAIGANILHGPQESELVMLSEFDIALYVWAKVYF